MASHSERDLYEVLQVAVGADKAVITAAYRSLARQYHPDVNPDPEAKVRMSEINAAYDILSRKEARAEYDRERARKQRTESAPGAPPGDDPRWTPPPDEAPWTPPPGEPPPWVPPPQAPPQWVSPPSPGPYWPPTSQPRPSAPQAAGAGRALLLGLCSVLCCPVLGPPAIYFGINARRGIRASGGVLGGGSAAMAGIVLGLLGTAAMVVYALYLLAMMTVSSRP